VGVLHIIIIIRKVFTIVTLVTVSSGEEIVIPSAHVVETTARVVGRNVTIKLGLVDVLPRLQIKVNSIT